MNLFEEILSEPIMREDYPAGVFTPVGGHRTGLPNLVILASCHGRMLVDYFNTKPEFMARFNIMRLETGPIRQRERRGIAMMDLLAMRRVLVSADVLLTYNMGSRHTSFALERIRTMLRPECRVITWTPPNFSAFWPVAGGYCGAIAVLAALDAGKTVDEIKASFANGTFDPLFKLRWRIEMGRVQDRDATSDVGMGGFIQRNHKTHKLFMGFSHPSFLIMAHMGAAIMEQLGFTKDDEAAVLGYNYEMGALAGEPETEYEFKHYGFTYPMRHAETSVGDRNYYLQQIESTAAFWANGGMCSIPLD